MDTKRCSICGEVKPRTEFYKDATQKSGLQARCKQCQKKMAADWWSRNGGTAYRKHAEYQKAWKNRHKDRRSRIATYGHTRRKYGITIEQFTKMLIDQLGRCAICGVHCVELDVDHCHDAGHIRALLCNPCNRGLAAFRDDPVRLFNAIAYLKKHAEG